MADIQPNVQSKISLAVQPSTRNKQANKDEFLINGYIEKEPEDGTQVYKRPCFAQLYATPGTAEGIWFNGQYNLLSVTSNTLYTNGVSAGAIGAVGPGKRLTFCNYGGTPPGVFINQATTSGGQCSYYNGSINSVGTGVSVPVVMGTVYLDGTIYILDAFGGIHGSNINDPTTWNALNVIVATADAQLAVYLAKQKVYVIAMMQFSTQVFFDNQNATGSPLAPLPGGYSSVGCVDPWSVATLGDEIMWVGQVAAGGLGVYLMRDLHITKVSTGPVDRILALGFPTNGTVGWFQGWWSGAPGHRFYVVNTQAQSFSLVYDLENGMWYEWASAANDTMPYVDSTLALQGLYTVQHSNGNIYTADTGVYTDFDGIPTVTIMTENWDAGTRDKKFIRRIDFVGDQTPGSTLSVSHTDDDYQTFSNVRTVDLSVNRPSLLNCGTTNKRAYFIQHTANTSLRLEDLMLTVQKGTL